MPVLALSGGRMVDRMEPAVGAAGFYVITSKESDMSTKDSDPGVVAVAAHDSSKAIRGLAKRYPAAYLAGVVLSLLLTGGGTVTALDIIGGGDAAEQVAAMRDELAEFRGDMEEDMWRLEDDFRALREAMIRREDVPKEVERLRDGLAWIERRLMTLEAQLGGAR